MNNGDREVRETFTGVLDTRISQDLVFSDSLGQGWCAIVSNTTNQHIQFSKDEAAEIIAHLARFLRGKDGPQVCTGDAT